MDRSSIKQTIENGKAVLGIELGSTRIKAVLIGEDYSPIASGAFNWENRLENGVWTYHLDEVWTGIQAAYAATVRDAYEKYGVTITKLGAIGFSAMMHGYLPFDKDGNALTEFRTWRNTMTEKAAAELTELLQFNIPQRWSIAHLYQAILNGEEHLPKLDFLTTLAGYVHWKLTGERVLGTGEAAGMFPINSEIMAYDPEMVAKFDKLIEPKGFSWKLLDVLPKIVNAGGNGGQLTEEGAKLLDPTGKLEAGIPVAPPEGDASTGMVATNSVAARTGNISCGTSVFAMIVLEHGLSKVYPEIDMVTTPTGKPVAMVHCNNCTSDINAWAGMLSGFAEAVDSPRAMGSIYTALFNAAMQAEPDCGGVVNVNYLSGEPVTGFAEGRPMMVRTPDAKLTFANFARSLVFGSIASLAIGMKLLEEENVQIDSLLGHGGFFKTKLVGQKLMAAALNTPVSVMETAGEGGPWGMAILAAYMVNKAEGETLEDYLNTKVFSAAVSEKVDPDPIDVAGFARYLKLYQGALSAEETAVSEVN